MNDSSSLLGYKIDNWGELINLREEYLISTGEKPCSIVKDAAALCTFVYAENKHRIGDSRFATSSGDWYVLTRETKNFESLNSIKSNVGNIGLLRGTLLRFAKFNLFDRLDNKLGGFHSMVFYRSNNGKITDIAYVPEGTSVGKNWKENVWGNIVDWIDDIFLADVCQALTGLSAQHTRAIQIAKSLNEFIKQNDCNIRLWFFGHSLGGGIAAACARACFDANAITFNPAGLSGPLHWRKLMQLVKIYRTDPNKVIGKNVWKIENNFSGKHNIVSYYTDRDFLSNEQYAKWNPIKWIVYCLTPPDGERRYICSGGHSLANICQNLKLKVIPDSIDLKSISNGQKPF